MGKPLTTQHLLLRQFSCQDVEKVYEIIHEKDILQYYPDPQPYSFEKTQQMINNHLGHWQKHAYGWWAVELINRPGLIGWGGLQYLTETDETEVGYLLSKNFWGKGYATELAGFALEYGFKQLGFDKIIGLTHPDNIASQRVLLNCGMTYLGIFNYFGMACKKYLIDNPHQV